MKSIYKFNRKKYDKIVIEDKGDGYWFLSFHSSGLLFQKTGTIEFLREFIALIIVPGGIELDKLENKLKLIEGENILFNS